MKDGADARLPFLCGRVMYLVLFCVRCRIAYGLGLGHSRWSLPVGQLKFELFKEPEREEREGKVWMRLERWWRLASSC